MDTSRHTFCITGAGRGSGERLGRPGPAVIWCRVTVSAPPRALIQHKDNLSVPNLTSFYTRAMSKLEDWLMWADTHALPDEDIKVSSGLPQGWPSGMMGEETAKKLHAMGITKVSIICQDAISMDKKQFEAKYAHAWTKVHAVADYFARAVENPERMAELKRRLSAAAPAMGLPAAGGLAGSALLRRVTDKNKVQQFTALMSRRLAGKSYRLLYTWSSDGRSNASFHARCDNQVGGITRGLGLRFVTLCLQGPTLVIVRSTTGHTFGGYADAPWTSPGSDYINAPGCFLFLVENPHNDAPTCFECKNPAKAMLCSASRGPSFGGGNDLTITSDGVKSYTRFPCSDFTYTDTLGRGMATFTGAFYFNAEDYEVWGVN